MTGQDRTGLGPFRIPLLLGGTAFAWYQGIKSWSKILANNPTEIIANNNNTLIIARSNGLVNPNLHLEIMFGTLMIIAACVFTIGLGFMFMHYLGKETGK